MSSRYNSVDFEKNWEIIVFLLKKEGINIRRGNDFLVGVAGNSFTKSSAYISFNLDYSKDSYWNDIIRSEDIVPMHLEFAVDSVQDFVDELRSFEISADHLCYSFLHKYDLGYLEEGDINSYMIEAKAIKSLLEGRIWNASNAICRNLIDGKEKNNSKDIVR